MESILYYLFFCIIVSCLLWYVLMSLYDYIFPKPSNKEHHGIPKAMMISSFSGRTRMYSDINGRNKSNDRIIDFT